MLAVMSSAKTGSAVEEVEEQRGVFDHLAHIQSLAALSGGLCTPAGQSLHYTSRG